ncbi:MAG: DNA topoisomerase I [Candidatus Lokiarchaeota archaeon]|nr:DNA topoisomerase I [Candidatus Lokiarchaeota archaeon]
MESLEHNGIIVLEPPEPRGIEIEVKGKKVELNAQQEQMAIAWAKKQGTDYVEDPVFVENFMNDFSKALGHNPPLELDDVDFSPVIELVKEEKARKESMTKEEKKEAREKRKARREELKEQYGYAIVNGQKMELANYMTEPSGIFMGRGKHPLRGRWKEGASCEDITLNLSPDAEVPEGDWKTVVWKPDCIWIAKWKDKLTGKWKYIWLHDSTPIKQKREEEKFNTALKIGEKLEKFRSHINKGLQSDSAKTRMIAAACYLIDRLCLRVGDEKDPDEADTVGATTLRAEHVTFREDSIVFDFRGKDYVKWHKEIEAPKDVYKVFKELHDNAVKRIKDYEAGERKGDPKKLAQLFPAISSSHVNRFLSEVAPNISAKDFRTYHASKTVKEELAESDVEKEDPDFIKKEAVTKANLEVARIMNHTKQEPKGWDKRDERFQERLEKADERIEKAKEAVKDKRKRLKDRKATEKERLEKKKQLIKDQEDVVERRWEKVKEYRKKRDEAKERWDTARARKREIRESRRKTKRTKKERLVEAQEKIDRAKEQLEKAKKRLADARERYEKSKAILEKKKDSRKEAEEKAEERIERRKGILNRAKKRLQKAKRAKTKLEIDYELAKESRVWNLNTSLKSYIHPKIVYDWCESVDYDWRDVYTKVLQRKFDWVEETGCSDAAED